MPTFFGITANAETIVRASGAIPEDPNVPPAVIEGFEREMEMEGNIVKVSRLVRCMVVCSLQIL